MALGCIYIYIYIYIYIHILGWRILGASEDGRAAGRADGREDGGEPPHLLVFFAVFDPFIFGIELGCHFGSSLGTKIDPNRTQFGTRRSEMLLETLFFANTPFSRNRCETDIKP